MAKRVLWLKEEFILVLGLYLKIPYFNGVVPSFQDVVNIIKNKFGISRTISSIKLDLLILNHVTLQELIVVTRVWMLGKEVVCHIGKNFLMTKESCSLN